MALVLTEKRGAIGVITLNNDAKRNALGEALIGEITAAFDDFRFFNYIDVPVCTVRQPVREIGRIAASLLFDTLAGNAPKEREHILPVDLVIREKKPGTGLQPR